jgi:hypothetical protein
MISFASGDMPEGYFMRPSTILQHGVSDNIQGVTSPWLSLAKREVRLDLLLVDFHWILIPERWLTD